MNQLINNYLVDSHCHLNFPEIQAIFPQILEKCRDNNIKVLQTICTKIEEFDNLLFITNQSTEYTEIFCSIGVHPLNIKKEDKIIDRTEIIDHCSNAKVIGIGETGLDFYRIEDDISINRQKMSFTQHIEASIETHLPLIIHSRNAENATLNILKQYANMQTSSNITGVIHCFTGSKEFAYSALDLGFYISASGIITFKNAKDLQEIFKDIPLNRILIETDSPYLAPIPYRGKSNQPGYVIEIAKSLSYLKNIPLEEVVSTTTKNFLTLFSKAKEHIMK